MNPPIVEAMPRLGTACCAPFFFWRLSHSSVCKGREDLSVGVGGLWEDELFVFFPFDFFVNLPRIIHSYSKFSAINRQAPLKQAEARCGISGGRSASFRLRPAIDGRP